MKAASRNDHASLLANIFFPGQQNVGVLDGGGAATPSFTTNSLLAFGKKRELPGFHRQRFGYVNNRDGSIRWLYPVGSRQAHFLRLYNGSGWRGMAFKLLFSIAFRLGLERMARSGTVTVFYKNQSLLGGLTDQFPKGKMAIFTGTFGENQKAVVALQDPQGKGWFFKLPLTMAAARLVQNEQRTLDSLAQLHLDKLAVPTCKPFAIGLLVSDVKPRHAINSTELQTAHFEALAQLAAWTSELSQLTDLPCWGEINDHLDALQHQPILNDLPPETVRRIIDQLLVLRNELAEEQVVTTALAHGDFTPWNMYLGQGRLHIYDWELSQRLPLLYDVFHFVFQTGVLVKRQPYQAIHEAIFSLKKNEAIRAVLVGQGRGFEQFYQLFLLRNISYYLLKYIRQYPLHPQSHWQLAAWDLALKNRADFPIFA